MKRSMYGVTPILILLWLILASPLPAPASPEADGEGTQEPPSVISPWRNQEFDLDAVQVRQALLELFEADGLTIQEPTGEDGTLRTDLVKFGKEKFGKNVSVPPPKATNKYPFFQLNEMVDGHYGMELMVREREDGSSRVQLRALLEARALDRRNTLWRRVPRVSNGVVERSYFARLAMKLQPALTSAAP